MFLILNVHTSLQPDLLAADADEYNVTRSLEIYLLWLFWYIMFNNSHGHCVDRVLLPYAQEIADADEDAIPLYSWGSSILACTYRELCKASRQNDRNAVGHPMIDQSPYKPDMYGDTEDNRPTMGTLWYSRQVWTR